MEMAKEEHPFGEKNPVYPFLFRYLPFRMAGLLLLCPTPEEDVEGLFCRESELCLCPGGVVVEVEGEVERLFASGFWRLRGGGHRSSSLVLSGIMWPGARATLVRQLETCCGGERGCLGR
jgi:hypothetical protein